MKNPRLAGRYAKSLLDLSIEQNQLEAVITDMRFISAICNSNPDFVVVLKSPVIPSDKKEKIIESITNDRVTNITSLFIRLLVRKARENYLPEIADAFIDQYNTLKNIHRVKITTATPISAELQNSIADKIKSKENIKTIELKTVVDEKLIGGFKLEMGDLLVDASILRDLNDVKKQFMSNEYIHKLR
jgi:F-type H+-transporting ATPase subunit delta